MFLRSTHARKVPPNHSRETSATEVLLEVQSPVRLRDKRIFCPGALNSKLPLAGKKNLTVKLLAR